jgi:Fe-S cluster assembly protein SufD
MIVTELTPFAEQFERLSQEPAAHFPDWVQSLRQSGRDRFIQVGFPTTKWEDWRFTPVTAIAQGRFASGPENAATSEAAEWVSQASLAGMACRLVFVNGRLQPDLSQLDGLPEGLAVGGLADDLDSDGGIASGVLGRQANIEHSPFTALNAALFRDGAAIRLADGVEIEAPVHLIFVTSGGGDAVCSQPRNVVRIGRESRLNLVETHVGAPGEAYLTNSVTEIELGEASQLDHHKLQSDSIAGYHVATTYVSQAASSRYRNHYFAFGAALSRNEIHCYHAGEQVETVLHGLYLVSGSQLADCRTRIDHAMPNCVSHEVYKGILDDRARGVFNGKILVYPDAQKTDAKQSNQALLLSDDAVIDTKPELEIYADDVRCTHGATVGELDPKALFYLRSRGIPEALARKMLIFAFANDVVQGLRVESLKRHLESVLLADHGLPSV